MRTLAIVQYASYRSFPMGGISRFVESVIPHLMERFDLKLIGMTQSEPLGRWTKIRVAGKNYDFLPIVSSRSSRFLPDRIRIAVAALRYRKAILAAQADAYYVHMTEAALPLLRYTKKPVIVHVHGLYNPFTFSRFVVGRIGLWPRVYTSLYPLLFSRCAKVLGTGSRADYLEFQRQMKIRSGTSIPTCVQRGVFNPRNRQMLRKESGIQDEEKIVLYAGRMTDVKDLPLLLSAIDAVSRSIPGVRLVLAGDGPARIRTELQCHGRGNVQFLGMIGQEQLALWMNVADVLALCSKTEGFPTVVVEALSCGLPVVSTPVGAIKDIIRDGVNGYISSDHNAESYSKVLKRALLGPLDRRRCCQTAEVYHSAKVSELVASQIFEALNAAVLSSQVRAKLGCNSTVTNQ